MALALPPFIIPCAAILLAAPSAAQQYGGVFYKEMSVYNGQAGELFGSDAASVGDLNNDGVDDFVVTAPGYDSLTNTNVGAVRLYSGANGTMLHEFTGSVDFETLGLAVVGVPDMNGDLVPDIAMSSSIGEGTVTIYSGDTYALLRTISAPAGAHEFGCDLTVLGDINANGFDELVIGADETEVGGISQGAVFLYDLDTGLSLAQFNGSTQGESFGCAVAPIGDCDSDGLPDLVVSAPAADDGAVNHTGKVRIVSSITGLVLLEVVGTRAGLYLGTSVLGIDDINGDLMPDFVVGSIRDHSGVGFYVGSVVVYSGLDGTELRREWGIDNHERFGATLAYAGDIDGDGKNDFLAGAPGDLLGGRCYVFCAAIEGQFTRIESESDDEQFGTAVVGLGDHDGDGSMGVLVTAPHADDVTGDEGGFYIYELGDAVVASGDEISSSLGGTITYDLDFPEQTAYTATQQFQMLVCEAGLGGQNLFGSIAPILDDPLFGDTLSKSYPGQISNPFGTLDAAGQTTIEVIFPAGGGAGLIGRTFYSTVVWFEQSGPGGLVIHGYSAPQLITVTP